MFIAILNFVLANEAAVDTADQIIQVLKDFWAQNSGLFIGLGSSIMAILIANIGTIITMGIKNIHARNKTDKANGIYESILIKQRQEYDHKVEVLTDKLDKKFVELNKNMQFERQKIEEKKAKAILDNTKKLNKNVEEIKKNISVDDLIK